MKHLTERKLILVLIAGCLVFLLYRQLAEPTAEIVTETAPPETATESAPLSSSSHERVIYTCRLGNEEIPAVQISEARSDDGQTTATIARASVGDRIEVTAVAEAPVWDYKAISAHSREDAIEVAFEPGNGKGGADWVLTLSDADTDVRKPVRDCQEVSDE